MTRRSELHDAPTVRAHEARLRRAFRHLLFLSLGAPTAMACGGDDARTTGGDAGTKDATVGIDGASGEDVMGTGEGGVDDGADVLATDAGSDGDLDGAAEMDGDATSGLVTCSDASVSAPYYTADSGRICYYYVDFSCPTYAPRQGSCYLNAQDCVNICTLDAGFFDCTYLLSACDIGGHWIAEAGAPVTVSCGLCPGVGRRPAGLAPPPRRAGSAVARYLAEASHLEAASVHAFRRLSEELSAHGAPSELVRTARRSARDEVRHARVTARLARRRGVEPASPRVTRRGIRRLERVALENAVEGCVRETFGAMVASWQVVHAADAEIARSMARIAADETRHAALAWAVDRWAGERLDAPARARLARARHQAVASLARELRREPPASVAREAGIPSSGQALTLLDGLSKLLWG